MILRLLSPLLLLCLQQADVTKASGHGYNIPAVPPIPAPLGCKSTSYVPLVFILLLVLLFCLWVASRSCEPGGMRTQTKQHKRKSFLDMKKKKTLIQNECVLGV